MTGEFFSALSEGKQTIIVSARGYETKKIETEITSATVEELTIYFEKTSEK